MSQITDKLRHFRNIILKPFKPLISTIRFFSGWIIPGLLIILIILPVFLIYLRSNQRENTFPEAITVKKGDLYKSLKVTATIEPAYSYDLKVYQNAEIEELSVKEGDFVQENQVLAKVKFINGTKLRETDILGQINSNSTEKSNLSASKKDAQNVTNATKEQFNTQIENKTAEISDLNQKINDKNKENADKKTKLTKERDEFQLKYNNLEAVKNIYDSLKTLTDELNAKRDQLQLFDINAQATKLKTSIDAQRVTRDNANLTVNSGICDTSNAIYNKTSCEQANSQRNLANRTLNDLETQLNSLKPVEAGQKTRLEVDIADIEAKIKALEATPEYNGYKDQVPPYSDQNYNAWIEARKAETKQELESRKNDLKILDDSKEVSNLEDQLKTLSRTKTELEANSKTQTASLNQSVNNLSRQLQSGNAQSKTLEQKLKDVQEDILDQESTKTLKAKLPGIVTNIKAEQGLEVAAGQAQFKIISKNFVAKLKVSAISRSKINLEMPVKINTDRFKTLSDLKISKAGISPVESTNTAVENTNPEYEVEVNLPQNSNFQYVSGESVDMEIIQGEAKNILFVPRNAVENNKVYVGIGEVKVGQSVLYSSFEEKEVETGLDGGINIEIIKGLKEDEKVFPVFPRTDEDKRQLQKQFKKN